MRVTFLAAALVVSGCGVSSTRLLVDLDVQPGEEPPVDLQVSLYDPFGPLVRNHELTAAVLPGRVIFFGLPSGERTIRVVVSGQHGRMQMAAAGSVTTVPGSDAWLALSLSASVGDADGDGVPDAVDDCPSVADPDQANSDGQGDGDACASDAGDLSAADLSGSDLGSNADLKAPSDLKPSSDLQSPPDLKPPSDLKPPPDLQPPSDMLPATTCSAALRVCDGFESATLNSTLWTTSISGGTIAIDSVHTFRGTRALHMRVDQAAGQSGASVMLVHSASLPALASGLFLRTYIYPTAFPQTANVFILVNGNGEGSSLIAHSDSTGVYTFNLSPSFSQSVNVPLGLNRWNCVEMQLTPGNGNGVIRLWIDGVQQIATTSATLVAPGNVSHGLGLGGYTGLHELWIDDYAIDESRIGCD